MRLVEETGLVGDVKNGKALPQEIRCISSAFNLAKGVVGHASGLQKVALHLVSGPRTVRVDTPLWRVTTISQWLDATE